MVIPDERPPGARGMRGRLRELIGTIVGLAVVAIASVLVVWWQGGHLRPQHARITPPASARSMNVTPPIGVPAKAQRLRVGLARDGETLQATAQVATPPVDTTASVIIRLIGIDAPLEHGPGGRPQCFGADAFRALQRLAPVGSTIWVIADIQLLDPSQRYLLYVWNSAGTFVNQAMVEGGYAREQVIKPDIARQDSIKEAVRSARSAGRGLWRRCTTR